MKMPRRLVLVSFLGIIYTWVWLELKMITDNASMRRIILSGDSSSSSSSSTSNFTQIRRLNTNNNYLHWPRIWNEPIKAYSSPSNNTSTTVVLCLIVRNETVYLDEFVDYYIALGVTHIYIYDNEPTPDLEFESWYERRFDIHPYVTIQHEPRNPGQQQAYERCLFHDSNNATYAAMFDIDEFLVLKQHTNIIDMLNEYCDEECGQISFNWVTMGTSNQTSYKPYPVTKRNLHLHTYEPLTTIIKTIVRPTYVKDPMDWSHSVLLKKGHWVDTNGVRIPRMHSLTRVKRPPYQWSRGPTNVAALYHYRFKSEAEFVNKVCNRGDALEKRPVPGGSDAKFPKCINIKKPQNYPRTGGVYDDTAWKFMKRICPRYGIYDQLNEEELLEMRRTSLLY